MKPVRAIMQNEIDACVCIYRYLNMKVHCSIVSCSPFSSTSFLSFLSTHIRHLYAATPEIHSHSSILLYLLHPNLLIEKEGIAAEHTCKMGKCSMRQRSIHDQRCRCHQSHIPVVKINPYFATPL